MSTILVPNVIHFILNKKYINFHFSIVHVHICLMEFSYLTFTEMDTYTDTNKSRVVGVKYIFVTLYNQIVMMVY